MKATIYQVTRRDFLRQTGVGAGALVLGCTIAPDALAIDLPSLSELKHGIPVKDVPFVAIKLNGDIVIITHRAEMGQGIRSSLAAVLADEMEADWKRVSLRQAPADSTKFGVAFPYPVPPETQLPYPYAKRDVDKPLFIVPADVAQFTDSSRSMAAYYMPMRFYGAALRRAFIHAAAKKWGVDPSECYAEQHKVKHKGNAHRPLDYRRLLLGAQKVPAPTYDQLLDALKKPNEWRYINKEKVRETFNDAADMVTGKVQYGADFILPGMLTAMIERCPVANGDVKSFDATEALQVPGVVRVMKVSIPSPLGPGGVGTAFLPHAGVAVLATNTWAAWQGRRKLKPTIVWDLSSEVAAANKDYDSVKYRRTLEESTAKPGIHVRHRGDVDSGFAQAASVVEAGYYVPHLGQAPMEPPVATAVLKGDHLEVWTPTQNPDVAQWLAGFVAFGVPADKWEDEAAKAEMRKKVTLHMPLLGGGFGRKSKPDYVAEAAFLAKENPGVPVRVQWTREDDIRFAYHNAVSHQYLKAGLGADGRPTALLQRSAFTSLFATLFPPPRKGFPADLNSMFEKKRSEFRLGGKYPYGSSIERSQGLEDMPFDVPTLRIENCGAPSYIRVGWMRSVANVYHAFAICSFADEMARAAGRDPKDYLLELIGPGRILELENEGVEEYYNNEFPTAKIDVPFSGSKVFQVVGGYPPDTARLRKVVEEVARMSDWDAKKGTLPSGRGLGIAAHRSFLSYVALVLDVSINDKNELTINEAHCAIDCGLAVNIDRVVAQVEGGINYGLSMAVLGEITVKGGAVEQSNFDNYPVLRIHQTPKKVNIHIVQTDFDPTGVGEPPTPVVAPALANAIVAAGGRRIREMPFRNQNVVF
ncbi:MAG TPA: molybdopterin cofactor-binding domain-containing protein [Thermoanaerobaculia bacterium]|nr:molybdopterin cofactor-binding domain-containing protein [Thermoanaerobaculia bacterium]